MPRVPGGLTCSYLPAGKSLFILFSGSWRAFYLFFLPYLVVCCISVPRRSGAQRTRACLFTSRPASPFLFFPCFTPIPPRLNHLSSIVNYPTCPSFSPHQYPTMAHPNRPSLMSRLFPQEDHPTGRLSSSDDPSSATLFSAEKAPFGSSSSASFQDESVRRNTLYQACFASFSNTTADHRVQQDRAAEEDIVTSLKSMPAIIPQQVSRVTLSLSATNASPCRGLCRRSCRAAHLHYKQISRSSPRHQFKDIRFRDSHVVHCLRCRRHICQFIIPAFCHPVQL